MVIVSNPFRYAICLSLMYFVNCTTSTAEVDQSSADSSAALQLLAALQPQRLGVAATDQSQKATPTAVLFSKQLDVTLWSKSVLSFELAASHPNSELWFDTSEVDPIEAITIPTDGCSRNPQIRMSTALIRLAHTHREWWPRIHFGKFIDGVWSEVEHRFVQNDETPHNPLDLANVASETIDALPYRLSPNTVGPWACRTARSFAGLSSSYAFRLRRKGQGRLLVLILSASQYGQDA